MSLVALIGGVLLYAGRRPLFALATDSRVALDARGVYDWLLGPVLRLGRAC